MRYNFISLHDRIRRRSDALQFAQEKDIIKSTSKCKTCASSLKVQYSQANTSYVFFYCPQCKTKESVKKDTFLYNKVSPFTQYCLLISILEHLVTNDYISKASFSKRSALLIPEKHILRQYVLWICWNFNQKDENVIPMQQFPNFYLNTL